MYMHTDTHTYRHTQMRSADGSSVLCSRRYLCRWLPPVVCLHNDLLGFGILFFFNMGAAKLQTSSASPYHAAQLKC